MPHKAYYNEIDPFAANWLRNLIAAGHIAPGDVDERDIRNVQGSDLDGYTQCHFFAGVGGWSRALRLAGWADSRPVWTGSCPCQPFSCAGKGKGVSDERHLWPDFHRLISECEPAIIFGEQVAPKAGLAWLDGVFADLEASGYACGASDMCAAGVGAPHIRQRLWWVADSQRPGIRSCGSRATATEAEGYQGEDGQRQRIRVESQSTRRCLSTERMGHHDRQRCDGQQVPILEGRSQQAGAEAAGAGISGGLAYPRGTRADLRAEEVCPRNGTTGEPGCACRLDHHHHHQGPQGHARHGDARHEPGRLCACADGSAATPGSWSDYEILPYRDGKHRRSQPGSFPLAHGLPRSLGPMRARRSKLAKLATASLKVAGRNRRLRLKGYGNAIVPEVAAEFITAFMETAHAS